MLPRLCRRSLTCLALAGLLAGIRSPARALLPGDAQGLTAPPSPGAFPHLTAEALDKIRLTLPEGFEGKQNLLLLYWKRDQTGQLDTWTAVAQALEHTRPDLRVYRMLVSAPENTLYRWWDNAALRAAESDPELLHWTVPLYTDKASFCRSLGIADNEHVVATILVDRTGRVLWKAQGASTPASRASLEAAAAAASH